MNTCTYNGYNCVGLVGEVGILMNTCTYNGYNCVGLVGGGGYINEYMYI